jgi:hypothetical protein
MFDRQPKQKSDQQIYQRSGATTAATAMTAAAPISLASADARDRF